MPISPENRKRYPKHWKTLSYCIRADRAKWRCELCGVAHGAPTRFANPRGGRVVLTVMHLDHQPENNAMDNLKAACQACHNRHDAPHRKYNRKRTLDARRGQPHLFVEA